MADTYLIYVLEKIVVEEEKRKEKIGYYFYCNYYGAIIPDLVQNVLNHKKHWDNSVYFGQLLYSELLGGYERTDNYFGITNNPPMTHIKEILVVDLVNRYVYITKTEFVDVKFNDIIKQNNFLKDDIVLKRWSFAEYMKIIFLPNKRYEFRQPAEEVEIKEIINKENKYYELSSNNNQKINQNNNQNSNYNNSYNKGHNNNQTKHKNQHQNKGKKR